MDSNWFSGKFDDKQFTFVYLRQSAVRFIKQARSTEEGSLYNCMSSIVFSAFCIEAYFNEIGEKLFPFWDNDFAQKLGHKEKLKLISHHVGLKIDFSRSPFQSFNQIFKFCNLTAHAKPDNFSDFEKLCTTEQAEKFLSQTEEMITAIHKAAGFGEHPFVFMGFTGWKKMPQITAIVFLAAS